MPAIAGAIESISLNGRIFSVATDAEISRKLGGFENEILMNGDGTARQGKTRVPWQLTGITVEVDDTLGDHEYLKFLADLGMYFPVTVTYVTGTTYQGTGQIVGEMSFSNTTALASFDMGGTGILTKQ